MSLDQTSLPQCSTAVFSLDKLKRMAILASRGPVPRPMRIAQSHEYLLPLYRRRWYCDGRQMWGGTPTGKARRPQVSCFGATEHLAGSRVRRVQDRKMVVV